MKFKEKKNMFAISIVDSQRNERCIGTDVQKRIASMLNQLGWKGLTLKGKKLPRSKNNPKKLAIPGEQFKVMKVPTQLKLSNDCGAYQMMFLKRMIDDPVGYRQAISKDTVEDWRGFLGIENPKSSLGEAIWKGEIRTGAAMMARDTIMKMRRYYENMLLT